MGTQLHALQTVAMIGAPVDAAPIVADFELQPPPGNVQNDVYFRGPGMTRRVADGFLENQVDLPPPLRIERQIMLISPSTVRLCAGLSNLG